MRKRLYIAMLAAALGGYWASALAAEVSDVIELAPPRTPARGETVQIQVTTGPLPSGARLTLMTESGEILGAVTPFGPARDRSSYTVPVPRTALVDGRLRLRLQVVEPGKPARKPRPEEVERIDLVLVPHSE